MSTLPNISLSSTTFDVEEVKIRRPRRAKSATAAGRPSALPDAEKPGAANWSPKPTRGWRNLTRLDWRRPQGMTLQYRHGDDPQVVVKARGREWSYPWDTAVLDILRDVTNR